MYTKASVRPSATPVRHWVVQVTTRRAVKPLASSWPPPCASWSITATTLCGKRYVFPREDALLLPALEGKAQELVRELQRDHEALHGRIVALREALGSASCDELYAGACAFTAAYFEHMHEEEQRHEAVIRAHLSVDELTTFARKSVERTAPSDQRMMLGFVVPAITDADANALLARLPAALASELRLLRNAAG